MKNQLARLLVLVGLVALIVGFAGTGTAWGQGPGFEPGSKIKVTHVSFLQGRRVEAHPWKLVPTTRALLMWDNTTDALIKLPEWEEGRAADQNEPASFRKGRPFNASARFQGPESLISADIWAESSDSRIPNLQERTVQFAAGVSRSEIPPGIEPAAPVGLARFTTNGLPLDRIAVVVMEWTWKARNLVFPDRVEPDTISLGKTRHEFYLIRQEARTAERLEIAQNAATPFFKKVVRWSCLWSRPGGEREWWILFFLLARLESSGMSYTYPPLTPEGYATSFRGVAADLDKLLDTGEGQCGMWSAFFVQLASAQGIGSLEWQSPELQLPGETVASPQEPPDYLTIPNPRDPTRGLVLQGFQGPADFNRYADTFKTTEVRAVGSGVRQEWAFGDHCYIGRDGWTYDPSFQRMRPTRDWLSYFNTLRRGRDDFFVMSAAPANFPMWWLRGRGIWFPGDGTWTSKGAGEYKYFLVDRMTGDFDAGPLQNP